MDYAKLEHEILSVEEVTTASGKKAIVKKQAALYKNFSLAYDAATGVLTVSVNEPIINGSAWQGTQVAEATTAEISINGITAGTFEVTGSLEIDLSLVTGTYLIQAINPLCGTGTLEVTV